MIAAARGTTIREEVNAACKEHVVRHSHFVISAAQEMASDEGAPTLGSNPSKAGQG